ncbi:transglutaminase [Sulfolobus sp. A20]|uniref:transglutaminase family protein n=1 Tax=Saccharolobus sp. A20 TaxID=1891280 RepID=UPI000845BD6E|nr:transglutaminase family protein [Sulfolobus sp. A20]TRM75800.1 transglutaminase family protein [Sulfolobus sp. A20-N-F8]TRM75911.1 transglutaminase family protein [Sulfolobus sp. E5]TRM78610.1 transglutaminase family protein [Sulfolobus sp. B5]TRM79988.1 transglutaminase family protein [Sulfolobus sp. D5]TRM83799.1 transglutaminase family protein [Sulfolobus sp. A20-N-F6]TRM88188.1 transglutaminase family protein [Sulfolobus sp. E3]TRM89694.1 transglutaminase family protein [Sulfolobus sp
MGSLKYKVFYQAEYEYEDVVILNDNTLRIVPYDGDNQRVIEEILETEPKGYIIRFKDNFGNIVYREKILDPHNKMIIRSKSMVEVYPKVFKDCRIPCSEDLVFTSSSSLIDVDYFKNIASELLKSNTTLDEFLRATVNLVKDRVKYKTGLTDVSTKAHESFELGYGVCQDFAQITIGILRAAGIPARYVMGLVNDTPKTTHAWVEVKSEDGWIPIDPTRNKFYDLQYVKFAIGRDYNDVAPIVGTFISKGRGWLKQIIVEVKQID